MSKYLSKFLAQTRRKANPELIDRWEWDARTNGDKNIKAQLANARRTATSLSKAGGQFSNLRPEHDLAIKAAVSAMQALASELAPLAAWAKDYKVFCDAEAKKQHAADLESIALKRWGNNDAAVQFESDLMQELGTHAGRVAFANWAHSAGMYVNVAVEEISCTVDGLRHGESQRARAASTVEQNISRTAPHRWTGLRGPCVVASWNDYEAYVSYRREVAKTTARIVQMATESK